MESMFSSNRRAGRRYWMKRSRHICRTSNIYTTSRLRGTPPSASEGRQRAWRSRPPGDQIVLLTGFAQECGVTPFLLGNGTNLLVADEGLDTLVIQTGEGLNRIALDGGIITADAGVSLARLGVFAAAQPHGTGVRALAFPAVLAAAW